LCRLNPLAGPFQVFRSRQTIVVGPIPDAKIVRRRGDDGVYRGRSERFEDFNCVAMEKPQPDAAAFEFGVWLGKRAGHCPGLYRANYWRRSVTDFDCLGGS